MKFLNLSLALLLAAFGPPAFAANGDAGDLEKLVAAQLSAKNERTAAGLACEAARNTAHQRWQERIREAIKSGDSKSAGHAGCMQIHDTALECLEAIQAVQNWNSPIAITLQPCQ